MPRLTKALESAKHLSSLLLAARRPRLLFIPSDGRPRRFARHRPRRRHVRHRTVRRDITSVSAAFTRTTLTFTVNFTGAVFAPSARNARSVYGFIDIDSDGNPATGIAPLTGLLGPGPAPNLGVEYGIDISAKEFTPGFVVYLVSGASAGIAPVTFRTASQLRGDLRHARRGDGQGDERQNPGDERGGGAGAGDAAAFRHGAGRRSRRQAPQARLARKVEEKS